MKVLFVCTGNVCRSVMAEFLYNKMSGDRGLSENEARSAGIAAEGYFKTPGGVQRALEERDITSINHTSQLVGRELMGWADIIVPMAKGHFDYLTDEYPEFRKKTTLFAQWTQDGTGDIDDPFRQSDAVYQKCRDRIERGLEKILERHVSQNS
ncbi:MAG: low molecular weight phosphatase family protein [Elusimicrobia bacterium]|nr:MAG: low molecular weight phosphatase family protein [Elusimicrobiota bacterium]